VQMITRASPRRVHLKKAKEQRKLLVGGCILAEVKVHLEEAGPPAILPICVVERWIGRVGEIEKEAVASKGVEAVPREPEPRV
jgi:hypothetical protein